MNAQDLKVYFPALYPHAWRQGLYGSVW